MNCTSCGDKYDTTRYSRTDGLCSNEAGDKYKLDGEWYEIGA